MVLYLRLCNFKQLLTNQSWAGIHQFFSFKIRRYLNLQLTEVGILVAQKQRGALSFIRENRSTWTQRLKFNNSLQEYISIISWFYSKNYVSASSVLIFWITEKLEIIFWETNKNHFYGRNPNYQKSWHILIFCYN